jgi:hypothetical protein
MGGLNFGSRHNISISNTDSNGNFILKTTYRLAKDKNDFYKIEAIGSNEYGGFSENINAKEAEKKEIFIFDALIVDKLILLNLTIYHSGISNDADKIIGSADYKSFNESGKDSVVKRKIKIRAYIPCFIWWQTSKNNITSKIYRDTLVFSDLNNEYSISY